MRIKKLHASISIISCRVLSNTEPFNNIKGIGKYNNTKMVSTSHSEPPIRKHCLKLFLKLKKVDTN